LLATFTNPAPANFDVFGGWIAALGTDRVLIGADGKISSGGVAYLFRTNVACNPIAPATKPASASNGVIGCGGGGAPSISSISIPRGESPPVRARSISTRAIARPTFDRSGSASGRNVISCRSPRGK